MNAAGTLDVSALVNCSSFYCSYIVAEGGTLTFNESAFELFVAEKLRSYFVTVDVDGASSIVFSVIDRLINLPSTVIVNTITAESSRDYVYYGLLAIAAMIASVGFLA